MKYKKKQKRLTDPFWGAMLPETDLFLWPNCNGNDKQIDNIINTNEGRNSGPLLFCFKQICIIYTRTKLKVFNETLLVMFTVINTRDTWSKCPLIKYMCTMSKSV